MRFIVAYALLLLLPIFHSALAARVHQHAHGVSGENKQHTRIVQAGGPEFVNVEGAHEVKNTGAVATSGSAMADSVQTFSPQFTLRKWFALVCVLVISVALPWAVPHLRGKAFLIAAFIAYAELGVVLDLFVARKGVAEIQNSSSVDATCVVLAVEALKLFISAASRVWTTSQKGDERYLLAEGKRLTPPHIELEDIRWFALPSLLSVANSILLWKGASEFATSPFSILCTVALWCLAFRTQLGGMRIWSLCLVAVGLGFGQSAYAAGIVSSQSPLWPMASALVACVFSSSQMVGCEYALKHDQRSRELDLDLQNLVSYGCSTLWALLVFFISDPRRFINILVVPSTLSAGFACTTTAMVLAQVVSGLLVSRLLKHSDSLATTVLSCFCGPLSAVLAPLLTTNSTGGSSALCQLASAVITGAGCCVYFSCKTLEVAALEEVEVEEDPVRKVFEHALRHARSQDITLAAA